ncbi:MAG: hypothetical protein IAC42_00840 [Spirochaetes bacterium]|uniref:Porin n=1 Tax=Candidatus Aphodenecus pullistercoris TaxID=2840669 RepID=A0A9D9E6V7_9SPIR|nr:hypothetical protein [Candidatus Aphodenecus pullistercoris]
MKKRILSVLLIALLTAGVAFADFTFSGNFDVGYTFGFDGTTELTAVDGDNSAPYAGFFYLKGGNEYISLDVRSEADVAGGSIVRGSGIAMTGTINLSNILNTMFTMEMPVAIELYAGNQSFSSDADYAYGDSHGIDDEIDLGAARTQYPFGSKFAYGDLVQVFAYGALPVNGGSGAGLLELRTQPVEGVRANIAYGISVGEKAQDFQVSAIAEFGTLFDLDFDLAVSASYVANIDNAADNSHFMADLTGGYGPVGAYVEYEYYNDVENTDEETGLFIADNQHNLYIGASYDLADIVVPLSFGAEVALNNMAEAFTTGASVSVDAALLDLHLYAKLGFDDFTDAESGYVTVGTYYYF